MMKGIVLSKKCCAVLLFLVAGAFAAITPALPSTDADDCYLISSVEELYGFAAVVNGSNGMTRNAKACGKLTKDITVNKDLWETIDNNATNQGASISSWTPIVNFEGSFDGNGHSISGLYLDCFWSTDPARVSFIANITGTNKVVIKNLNIKDSFFSGTGPGSFNIGVLVTEVPQGSSVSIENSHVEARAICNTYTGGLIGLMYGSAYIEGSSFTGELSGAIAAGGLVATEIGSSKLTITNSFSKGLHNLDSKSAYAPHVGGLIGYASGTTTIEKSHSEFAIKKGGRSGGLIGYAVGKVNVTECYNTAPLKGEVVGGLIAQVEEYVHLFNSYNIGALDGSRITGGILGHSAGEAAIVNSFNMGENSEGNKLGCIIDSRVYRYGENNLLVENAYCPEEGDPYNGGINIVENTFKSGSLGKKLHAFRAEDVDGSVWGQDVGKDDYPVLTGTIKNAKEDVFRKLSFVTFEGDTTAYPTQYQEGFPAEIPEIVNSGYVYAWYDNPEFTGKKYHEIPASTKGDLTLYARLLKITPPAKDGECYSISNAEELYSFAAIVNGSSGMTKDSLACAKLTDDIVLNKSVLGMNGTVNFSDTSFFFPWTPMMGFGGTFDGQNHVISGLYVDDPYGDWAGFIVYTEGDAVIKNLGVVDSYIRGGSAGGLVGLSSYYSLKIFNCFNASHIVSVSTNAGGLVGRGGDSLIVQDSYNSGFVESGRYAGGIIGAAADISIIKGCHNVGTIRGSDAGGIIGEVDGKKIISWCYNEGLIEGRSYSGGILGSTYRGWTRISESYNKGDVGSNDLASKQQYYHAGGLVGGKANTGYADIDTLSIINSYNVGNVFAGDKDAGGLAGSLYSSMHLIVKNSYNIGEFTASDSKYHRGGILGNSWRPIETDFDNSFYLAGDSTSFEGLEMSASDVEDGSLLQKLHNYNKDEIFGTVWTQEIGKDLYPVLKGSVYNIEFMVATTTVKTISVFAGTDMSLVKLPEKEGYTYVPVELPNVMPEKDLVVYGKFVANSYTITVSVNDSTMGSVTGLNETGVYMYNASVSLKAVPAEGYEFSNWEDNLNARASRTITVKNDAQYVAVFKKAESSSSSVASSSSETSSSSEVSSSSETSSSSAEEKSSSSETKSSSSSANSSSSETSKSSSSSKKDAIVALPESHFGMIAEGRRLVFWNADVGEKFAIMDMQGRVIRAERVNQSRFEVCLQTAGGYIVRIGRIMVRVNLK